MSATTTLDAPAAGTPGLHGQIDLSIDAIAYVHYFLGGMDWFVTGYDPEADVAYGWAEFSPGEGEFSLFTLAELRETHANMRLVNPAGPDLMIPVAVE